MKNFRLLLLFCFIVPKSTFSQVVKVESMSTGLLYPVGIMNSGLPFDNRLFVLEKRGRIKIVNRLTGVVTPTPFLDIYSKVFPITTASDERGLLGLAFHPDYANNGYFYVNYINPAGKTIIARYQVSAFPDTALSQSEQIIMSIHQPYANHNGGNLMFGPDDGYLYISMGDGGNGGDPGNRAQNKDSLLGKTLRIDINNPSPPYYFSAPGNPFYGATPGRDEIYDWGLRNHWRCSFDRLTHDLWIADVGQNQYEEINFQSRCDTVGHNYGWRCYEGNTAYNTAGCLPQSNYTPPVFVYAHSLGCSVTGGYVYRGAQEGGLFGKYLFTDYCSGRIWATEPNGSGGWNTSVLTQSTTLITNNYSSMGEDIEGELYLAGVASGRIYRLRDTACAPTAYINSPDTLFLCGGGPIKLEAIYGTGLTYSWTINSANTWTINSGQGTNVLLATPDWSSTATIIVSVSNGTCSAISNSILVIPYSSFTGLGPMLCHSTPPFSPIGFPLGGSFSGPGIVNGVVFNAYTAGIGTHTITYTYADTTSSCYYSASGCIFNSSGTVQVVYCGGLEEQNNLKNIVVYPNPGHTEFNIEFYTPNASGLELTVVDGFGRVILESKLETKAGKQNIPFEMNDVSDGVYFLFLKTERSVFVEKIFVSK